MNKLSIGLAVLCIGILYIAWHIIYRNEVARINIKDEMTPLLWLRESYVTKNGSEVMLEAKEECFSLYELNDLYSVDKDIQRLQQFCESTFEDSVNGYTITASCRNQSARFYVDVHWTSQSEKLYEWQQNIYDFERVIIQQDRMTFQQQGTCNVSN